jgi:uncharacterized protein (TIGR02246 family)
MKFRVIVCAITALSLLLCLDVRLFASDSTKDQRAVLAVDQERTDAQIKQDAGRLDRLLGDDLTYVHASGLVQSKAEFINDLKSGKRVYKTVANSDVEVRLLQDAAVITAKSEISVSFEGKENDLSLRVIEVYAKRNGGWQLIAYQSTRLKP